MPIDPVNYYSVDCLESGVHLRVSHHPYRKADICGVVHVVASPEGKLQGAEGVSCSIDGGENGVLVIFVVPPQDFRTGMAKGIVHHASVHTCVSSPARECRRLWVACIGVEVIKVGQGVQRTTECAESHHWRPMSIITAALWPHIHVILRIGLQSCQQQTVCANVGDDGGWVGHKACWTVRYIVIDRSYSVQPPHQCRRVSLPIQCYRRQCLAWHKVAHFYIVNIQMGIQRVGVNDCQTSRRPGVTVCPNHPCNPIRVAWHRVQWHKGRHVQRIRHHTYIQVTIGASITLGPKVQFQTVGWGIEIRQHHSPALQLYCMRPSMTEPRRNNRHISSRAGCNKPAVGDAPRTLKILCVWQRRRGAVGEHMFQHRVERICTECRETERIVRIGRKACHGIWRIAPHKTARMPCSVAVGDTLHRPRSILVSRAPFHLHGHRAQRIHPHGRCRACGHRRRHRLGMQPHYVAARIRTTHSRRSDIRHTGCRIPRLKNAPLPNIELTSIQTHRTVHCNNQVSKAVIMKRRVEIIMVPTHGTDQRVHRHLLKHRAEPYHASPHIGHVCISEINSTAWATHDARVATIEVDTRNHGLPVQFVALHQLLGIAGKTVHTRQTNVGIHEKHIGRVANKNCPCSRNLSINCARQAQSQTQ